MSLTGILTSNFFQSGLQALDGPQAIESRRQQFRQDFQQLGQDLQSGNLSAAQSHFAALEQLGPQASSTSPVAGTSSAPATSPIAQDLLQLGKDLQSGNLSAAQQDYTRVQQDFQAAAQTHGHHHHHHRGGDQDQNSSNPISQLFNQLGQALQSGNLSAAQQAYATLQQDVQQFAAAHNRPVPTSQTSTGSLSLNA